MAGKIISKDLLFKDVHPDNRAKRGERAVLDQVDWESAAICTSTRIATPRRRLIKETKQEGGEEYWIYYNTTKFSGKKFVVKPGKTFTSADKGVYNILVYRGEGRYDGHPIKAGDFDREKLPGVVCQGHQSHQGREHRA